MPELTGKQIELYRNLRTIEAAVKAGYKLPPDDSGHWPERGYPDAEDVPEPTDLPAQPLPTDAQAAGGDRDQTGVPGTTYPAHVDPPAPQPGAQIDDDHVGQAGE